MCKHISPKDASIIPFSYALSHNKVVYLFIYKGEQCCTPFTFQR